MAKIMLDNGIVFEGTVEEVKEFLNGRTDDRGKIERKFKVGDYVKIVDEASQPIFPEGSIVKIKEVDESDDDVPYLVVSLDGKKDTWCSEEDIELVTEEEKEQAKWAEIGRKPGEYKAGDIVQFTEDTGSFEYQKDSITILDRVNGEKIRFGGEKGYTGFTSWIKLIVPVEQRFDLR